MREHADTRRAYERTGEARYFSVEDWLNSVLLEKFRRSEENLISLLLLRRHRTGEEKRRGDRTREETGGEEKEECTGVVIAFDNLVRSYGRCFSRRISFYYCWMEENRIGYQRRGGGGEEGGTLSNQQDSSRKAELSKGLSASLARRTRTNDHKYPFVISLCWNEGRREKREKKDKRRGEE